MFRGKYTISALALSSISRIIFEENFNKSMWIQYLFITFAMIMKFISLMRNEVSERRHNKHIELCNFCGVNLTTEKLAIFLEY